MTQTRETYAVDARFGSNVVAFDVGFVDGVRATVETVVPSDIEGKSRAANAMLVCRRSAGPNPHMDCSFKTCPVQLMLLFVRCNPSLPVTWISNVRSMQEKTATDFKMKPTAK
ncbi:hypothetical protein V6N12_044146 [Hibiscus sabdariffa]|uniref:Uncharacterized protein n=1 Tax=Hibiscus sabdariffa TaxID=183260 RepID=A0ABR2DGF8_9ROSI